MKVLLLLLLAALLRCAGSSGGGADPDLATGDAVEAVADAAIDTATPDATCTPPEVVDAVPIDALPLDTVPGDTPIDTTPPEPGPVAAMICTLDCTADADCGAGWACLTFQDSGQRFCAPTCPVDGCPAGFGRVDVGGTDRCVPLRGDCRSAFAGLPCDGDTLAGFCKHDFGVCTSTDWRPGVCTYACQADDDCGGFGRCVPGLQGSKGCAPYALGGPDGCGAGLTLTGEPGGACRDAADCDAGQRCVVVPDGSLAPFCATPCATTAGCAADQVCAAAQGVDGGNVCLPTECRCATGGEGLVGQLLQALGLPRCAVGFRSAWLRPFPVSLAFDAWRLPAFHALHDLPARAHATALQIVTALDAGTSSLARARLSLDLAAGLLDRYSPAEVIPEAPALEQALADLIVAAGGAPDPVAIAAALADVPAEVTSRLAPIVVALGPVIEARAALDAEIGDAAVVQSLFATGHGLVVLPKGLAAPAPGNPTVRAALLSREGPTRLYRAAADLLEAVEQADLAGAATDAPFSASIATPLGPILLRGGADDTYNQAVLQGHPNALLVVDTGGDDTVIIPAGATADAAHPVSLHLDLGGNDTYGYVPVFPAPDPALLPADADGRWVPDGAPDTTNGPVSLSEVGRQGSGRLGVGLLVDLGGGDDAYRSLRLSQGYGFLGVGLLQDDGGTDTYEAEALSQGAAMFGIGLLVDEGGSDQYRSATLSQGFAYALGAGVLYDADGDDAYQALLGDPALGGVPLYFNPQNPGKSNSSMSQGVGFGRRADTSDGVYMSGGLGILRDRAGRDTYRADIFAQASGYWFGVGVLADGGGDDTYDGRWYVQGSAAHFAAALFLEGGGDDRYDQDVPPMATSIGVGHDFSLGLVDEAGGDDVWNAPGLALGSGNSNGLGILLERGGNDTYVSASGGTLGWANGADRGVSTGFQHLLTTGLFLDGGGGDTYQTPGVESMGIANDVTWLHPPTAPENAPVERGGGLDGEGPLILP